MDGQSVADTAQGAGQQAQTPTRGARRKSETHRRLLRAARVVFAREGLENATITQITSEADVGFGTFYLHFATKEEAYRAVVTDGFDELARELAEAQQQAIERDAPWWDVLRASVRANCLFAEKNRELFQVMFTGGSTAIGLGRELQEQFAAQLTLRLPQITAHAAERGQPIPYPYPPQPIALAIVVSLTRTTLWWFASDEKAERSAPRLTLDEFTDTLTRFITAALWGQTPTA